MSKCIRHEQCPNCARVGRDRNGNNLGIYSDGATYCFSCNYSTRPTLRARLEQGLKKEKSNDLKETLLPTDYSREIPATAWRWLLQYQLPYSYWQTHCGYSEKEGRIIFNVGNPLRFAIGRALSVGTSKWKVYGDKSSYVEIISPELSNEVVLVEDLISAHKCGQITTAIPLFGTSIHDKVLKELIRLNKPVALWLDNDQYTLLPKKIGRLQALTGLPVRVISTRKDPKSYSTEEIKEVLQ